MPTFACPPDALHRSWDNRLPPALVIDPGDTVTFSTVDAADGAVEAPTWATPRPPTRDLGTQSSIRRGHPLSGPIAIRGAGPGDVLAIEVLEIVPHDWGWTGSGDNGVLGIEVTEHSLIFWDLRGTRAVPWFAEAGRALPVRVPIRPFCGVMGVAPAEQGEFATRPPRPVGGNMDVRRLIAGSTLYLPIAVEGALFSVGDVHAAQGEGEVCGTGIECRAGVTLRFDLRRNRHLASPEFHTPEAAEVGPRYGVTGIGPDLMAAARDAIRQMIAYLQAEHDLRANDAYILCSVAVDLVISEVVNPPNWVVTALLPLDILTDPGQ
ncbi:MAG: acetamidase/formamidase family protein [Chloroflexota bacterium]